jgi:hypothetical protein
MLHHYKSITDEDPKLIHFKNMLNAIFDNNWTMYGIVVHNINIFVHKKRTKSKIIAIASSIVFIV